MRPFLPSLSVKRKKLGEKKTVLFSRTGTGKTRKRGGIPGLSFSVRRAVKKEKERAAKGKRRKEGKGTRTLSSSLSFTYLVG